MLLLRISHFCKTIESARTHCVQYIIYVDTWMIIWNARISTLCESQEEEKVIGFARI